MKVPMVWSSSYTTVELIDDISIRLSLLSWSSLGCIPPTCQRMWICSSLTELELALSLQLSCLSNLFVAMPHCCSEHLSCIWFVILQHPLSIVALHLKCQLILHFRPDCQLDSWSYSLQNLIIHHWIISSLHEFDCLSLASPNVFFCFLTWSSHFWIRSLYL